MTEQWRELKDTIMALSTSEGTATQQEVCKFLINLMDLLEKQMPKPKVGHWIKTPKAVMGEGYMWYCDKCEHQVYQDSSRDYPSEKYCPKCGDKKIEPQGSEGKE